MNNEIKKIILALPLMVIFFIVFFGYLVFSHLTGLIDLQIAWRNLPAYFWCKRGLYVLLFICHGIVFEYVFRYALLSRLLREFSPRKSFWIHIVFINVLMIIPLLYLGFRLNTPGGLRLWFYEGILQVFWGIYYWRNLSYIQTGFFHGFFNAMRFIVFNGDFGPVVGCFAAKVHSPLFYDLKIFSAALALGILIALLNEKQRNILSG